MNVGYNMYSPTYVYICLACHVAEEFVGVTDDVDTADVHDVVDEGNIAYFEFTFEEFDDGDFDVEDSEDDF